MPAWSRHSRSPHHRFTIAETAASDVGTMRSLAPRSTDPLTKSQRAVQPPAPWLLSECPLWSSSSRARHVRLSSYTHREHRQSPRECLASVSRNETIERASARYKCLFHLREQRNSRHHRLAVRAKHSCRNAKAVEAFCDPGCRLSTRCGPSIHQSLLMHSACRPPARKRVRR
jgi:hypothetical protein